MADKYKCPLCAHGFNENNGKYYHWVFSCRNAGEYSLKQLLDIIDLDRLENKKRIDDLTAYAESLINVQMTHNLKLRGGLTAEQEKSDERTSDN